MPANQNRTVLYCLAVLGITWIVVGILRNLAIAMVIRPVIQVSPLFLAMVVLQSRSGWVSSIGTALLLEWLAGMLILWSSWRRLMETNSHFIFPMQEAVLSGVVASVATLGVFRAAGTGSDVRV